MQQQQSYAVGTMNLHCFSEYFNFITSMLLHFYLTIFTVKISNVHSSDYC